MPEDSDLPAELEALDKAIQALEAQRAVLGDTIVDQALAAPPRETPIHFDQAGRLWGCCHW